MTLDCVTFTGIFPNPRDAEEAASENACKILGLRLDGKAVPAVPALPVTGEGIYIVACQRGGVSNKQDTGHRDPLV